MAQYRDAYRDPALEAEHRGNDAGHLVMPDWLAIVEPLIDFQESCWVWVGKLDTKGYGKFGHRVVHRRIYEALVEPIPTDLQCDHLCKNKACVNPDHIEIVTCLENIRRRDEDGHHNAKLTACKRGHPFTEASTYLTPDGRRQCRECNKLRTEQYRKRARETSLVSSGDWQFLTACAPLVFAAHLRAMAKPVAA